MQNNLIQFALSHPRPEQPAAWMSERLNQHPKTKKTIRLDEITQVLTNWPNSEVTAPTYSTDTTQADTEYFNADIDVMLISQYGGRNGSIAAAFSANADTADQAAALAAYLETTFRVATEFLQNYDRVRPETIRIGDILFYQQSMFVRRIMVRILNQISPDCYEAVRVTSLYEGPLPNHQISPLSLQISPYFAAVGHDWLINCTIIIIAGTGTGQFRRIREATSDLLSIDVRWDVMPDSTSVFRITP